MKLGRASRRALVYLHEHANATAEEIGKELWPERYFRQAAAARMLLGRLRKRELVEQREHGDGLVWVLAPAGRAVMLEHIRDIKELIAKSSIGQALADVKERGIDAHLADLERGRFK